MSISLSPRRPLAAAVAFSVIVGGLSLAPMSATAATPTTAENQNTVINSINTARNSLEISSLASSPALTAIAQKYATTSATNGRITKAPTTITVDADTEAGIAPTFAVSVGVISSKASAVTAYDKLNAEIVTSSTYDFAGIGYATKGTRTYVVALVADYATSPLETQKISGLKITGKAKAGTYLQASAKFSTFADYYTYQWLVGGEVRSTGSYFYLDAATVGKTVTLKLIAEKQYHKTLTLTAKTAKVAKGTIVLYNGKVDVEGERNVKSTVYAYAYSFNWIPNLTTKYQWYRGTTKLTGKTNYYYTQVAADKGKKISVKVTMTAPGFTTLVKQSAVKLVTKSPKIGYNSGVTIDHAEGAIVVGTVLTVNKGDWFDEAPQPTATGPGIKLAVQWLRDGKAITGATKDTYTIKSIDIDSYISVKVTATKTGRDATTTYAYDDEVFVPGQPFTQEPTYTQAGTVVAGKTVKVTVGNLEPGAKAIYSWYQFGGKKVATTSSVKVTSSMVKAGGLWVNVTVKKAGYSNQFGSRSFYFYTGGNDLP